MVNFKPIKGKILVEEITEEITKGGLILPTDKSIEALRKGIVVAVGNETKTIEVNDKIQYQKYYGITITLKGKDFILLNEADVITFEKP